MNVQNSVTTTVTTTNGTFEVKLDVDVDGNLCEVSIYNPLTGFGGAVQYDIPSNQFGIMVKGQNKLAVDENGNVNDVG